MAGRSFCSLLTEIFGAASINAVCQCKIKANAFFYCGLKLVPRLEKKKKTIGKKESDKKTPVATAGIAIK